MATIIIGTTGAADPVVRTTVGAQLSLHVLLSAGVVAFIATLGMLIRPRRSTGDPV